jgi:hypothetical protein
MSALIREIQKNEQRARTASQAQPVESNDANKSNDKADQQSLIQFWEDYGRIVVNLISVVTFYGVGIAWYHTHEKWTVLECIYFTTVTRKF